MRIVALLAILSSIWLASLAQSASCQAPPSRPVTRGLEMLPDAPDFTLETFDGKHVRLRDYRGKAVVLNFWASWCVPCKKEIPWLIEFQNRFRSRDLIILGISMDTSLSRAKQFSKEMAINYPVVMGSQSVADKFYVQGLPVSVFIDRSGKITDQVPGLATASFLKNEIELALQN
jgi:peroxiredoxin